MDIPRSLSTLEIKERPLAALRRYYPGFFGAAFLVLLRIAIGWHLMYEGLQKILSTPEGKHYLGRYFEPTKGPSFSSEGYQRNATGPFARQFRSLIPDVDSRDALNIDRLKDSWLAEQRRVANYYAFDTEQQEQAGKELTARETLAQVWFEDPENREKIKKYLDGLDELARIEAQPHKMTYEVERFYDKRKSLESDRRSLVAPIDGWTKVLRDSWVGLANETQKAEKAKDGLGEYKPDLTEVQKADFVTMIGLTVCGLCLMLGLFTPVAALGASGFLMLFYISMPPWPGLPEAPNAEGHYSIVNKNLIEFFACLSLAATPSGLWLGLDALLFGWIDRLRARRANARLASEIVAEINAAPGERVAVSIKPKQTR